MMRIAASLSVRDEVELVPLAISHLRRIGVDLIVACDMGSTDGTFEFLESQRSDDDFWLFRLNDEEPDNSETWSRAQVALLKSARADWAIFLDADEFWLPRSGCLAACEALSGSDVLTVSRYNVPVGDDGPFVPGVMSADRYDEVLCFAQDVADARGFLRDNPNRAWTTLRTAPKVMVRPDVVGTIRPGVHDIWPTDARPLRRCMPPDVVIAHLPFTTPARFRRKIGNIRRMFGVHDVAAGKGQAWHWRRWLDLEDRGLLEEEFAKGVLTEDEIIRLRAEGLICSAADLLAERSSP